MPRAPRSCAHPGCPNTQPCDDHLPEPWKGSHSHGFPKHVRKRILERDPVCRCDGCQHHDGLCNAPSTEADHVVPQADGGNNHPDNGRGLCTPCHAAATERQRLAARWGHA